MAATPSSSSSTLSLHTTPEHWTELIAARRQRRLCADQVDAIKRSCRARCGKKHIHECAACYGQVLERMRRRYMHMHQQVPISASASGSASGGERGGREWFTQRKAFLQELDGLFGDAKRIGAGTGGGAGIRSVRAIEARIESEKEAWYRWVLRRHPEFLAAREGGGARQDELREMLDDPDRSREGMVGMVWQGIGEPVDWAERLERLVEKVEAATAEGHEDMEKNDSDDSNQDHDDDKNDPSARGGSGSGSADTGGGGGRGRGADVLKKIYAREFFLDSVTGEPLRNAQPYLKEYEGRRDATLEEVIGRLAQGLQESRRVQPQREMHRLRLDDLRRAKTAFELNKAQAKGRAGKGQGLPEVTPGEDLYDLPTCLVCGSAANAGEVLSCSVCQAVTQSGGRKKLTVYCTRECYEVGHESHIEMEHDCEADGRCAQLFDEDVVMENSGPGAASGSGSGSGSGLGLGPGADLRPGSGTGAFACRACFEERDAALFCSERCALENIGEHRQRRHGIMTTRAEEAAGLIAPLADVVGGILRRENPGLEMRLMVE